MGGGGGGVTHSSHSPAYADERSYLFACNDHLLEIFHIN